MAGSAGLQGIRIAIDSCIAPLVKALNDVGMTTVASCCGHGKQLGRISLADGRELLIVNHEQAERIAKSFPPINPNGQLVFEPNHIPYGQDMSFYVGIPAGVQFAWERISKKQVKLTAPGYGGEPYGNDALYVYIEDLPEGMQATVRKSSLKRKNWLTHLTGSL